MQLLCRPLGERERHNAGWIHTFRQQIHYPLGNHLCLAQTRRGDDLHMAATLAHGIQRGPLKPRTLEPPRHVRTLDPWCPCQLGQAVDPTYQSAKLL